MVKLALDGDDDALRELHGRYVQHIYSYAYMQVHNHHDAEEILQDVFWKMARSLHQFKGKSSFKTWLFTISRNVTTDYLRKKARDKTVATDEIEAKTTAYAQSAEEEVLAGDDDLKEAMKLLSEDHRTVLSLRFIHGCSLMETAKVMRRTVFSVKAMQSRASKKLAEILARKVGEA
ncbi:RNA polymerase sigma factor [Paenalkalicoccus suaedae]|uniref:RNA polymerase sigma factor n=1 Tax=Paenalkalicoccus suaedae TaxID=2592382 RepID=UPI00158DD7A3|nr:RNA polymerase sigma factor [Paenalkalicoccus suaedae]